MTTGILIRGAVMADCPGIQSIHRHDSDPWQSIDECRAWVEHRLQCGFYIRLAELGGKIAGHGEWIVDDSMGRKILYLGVLQVDEDCQRRGIGRLMLEDGMRYARERQCAELVTIPDTDNTSADFYRKCGFIPRRNILRCRLPAHTVASPASGAAEAPACAYEPCDAIPFDDIRDQPFVFGLSQASSRHMWEVCNCKPRTDGRMTPAIRFSDGGYAQLSYFEGNKTALVLFWCPQPKPGHLHAILRFAFFHGIDEIEFMFFESYKYLFKNLAPALSDTEIFKSVT